jgi:hypothetical protein
MIFAITNRVHSLKAVQSLEACTSPRIAQSAILSWHRMKTLGVRCSRSSQIMPSPISTSMILNGTLSAKFSQDCAEFFMTLLLSSNSTSSGQSTRGYGLSLTIQILRTNMHCFDACSHVFCRPDQFGRSSYVDDISCVLVSSLPPLFYTMYSHRDIYIYQC